MVCSAVCSQPSSAATKIKPSRVPMKRKPAKRPAGPQRPAAKASATRPHMPPPHRKAATPTTKKPHPRPNNETAPTVFAQFPPAGLNR